MTPLALLCENAVENGNAAVLGGLGAWPHSPWHLEVWLWKEVPSVVRKESVFIVWIVSLTVENRSDRKMHSDEV
ncbi:unnamed protein product [Rangifer tarandus platyrhynchus]|uniref:Uncharacterized protein n=2 Tax=Rangifer tarandus platyrhynchus TaxID=3082113 RepID=A0ACB0DTK1_RANTA|nr:unnamed protein product [Rangifer tarandus platyrhynchus]CAI9691615.1 unnamed protein product [Rangifer tarandus platyrhynchus]